MFGYLEGLTAGPELEKLIKKYKKQYKSFIEGLALMTDAAKWACHYIRHGAKYI